MSRSTPEIVHEYGPLPGTDDVHGVTGSAMVLIGISSPWWAVILGIVVLIYKLAPPLRMRDELVLSLGLAALGVAYFKMA
jgi:hypothetical protein